MGLIDGLITGIAGVGQGLMQRQTDKLNAERNFAQNMEMSKYQFSKDLEMWNKANEYNSPSAQMARYQSAGLNPNLIYGSGTASAGNTSTSLPKYQAPTYEQNYHPPIDLANILGMYQDFRLKQAQIDNVKEMVRVNRVSADLKELELSGSRGFVTWDNDVAKVHPSKYELARGLSETQLGIQNQNLEINKKMLSSKLIALDLQNDIREKTRNWFVANQLSNMVGKALAGFGISKLGNRLAPGPKYYKSK